MEDRRTLRGCVLVVALVMLASEVMINSKVDASASTTSWWSLGLMGCDVPGSSFNACRNCASMNSYNVISKDQEAKCQSDPSTVTAVSRGSRHAILDCQRRFNNSRWNCSTFISQPIFGKFIETGTKESAIAYSYMMAGSMWAVAEDCAQQRIVSCPCIISGTEPRDADGNIIFYSCDANVGYAMDFIKTFTPIMKPDANSDTTTKVNYMNSIAGMNVMKQRRRRCRCHGVSGTCTAQTCHESVMSVESAGAQIVEQYEAAQQVQEPVMIPENEMEITNITYTNPSPDFCNSNVTIGIPGVKGRVCELNHPTNNCSHVCCGEENFKTDNVRIPIEKCEFIFCCRIECKIEKYEYITVSSCK